MLRSIIQCTKLCLKLNGNCINIIFNKQLTHSYLRFSSVYRTMASETGGDSDSTSTIGARVILQQCLSAELMVQPATDTEAAKFVQINKGLIVYICFLKGANEKILEKMVKSVLSAKLSEDDNGKRVSVLDLPGDVLIIPQATLGGTLKGKVMQYHKNIGKDQGLELYSKFVQQCEEMMGKSEKCKEKLTAVKAGTYGNRQVFSTVTNGPYSHCLEF